MKLVIVWRKEGEPNFALSMVLSARFGVGRKRGTGGESL